MPVMGNCASRSSFGNDTMSSAQFVSIVFCVCALLLAIITATWSVVRPGDAGGVMAGGVMAGGVMAGGVMAGGVMAAPPIEAIASGDGTGRATRRPV
jgi:hypothetical protein